MKRGLLGIGLVAMLVLSQGCSFSFRGWEEPPESAEWRADEPRDATIVEIDAVSKLSFDNNRQNAYRRIAGREGISDSAQVHLVVAVFRHLSFENAKMDVLLTLVNNPSFSQAAKRAILDRLDRLAFENNKTQILDAMTKR